MINEERVFALLERRDECRRREDYDGADRLKDQLYELNVLVNDRERSWTIRQVCVRGIHTHGIHVHGAHPLMRRACSWTIRQPPQPQAVPAPPPPPRSAHPGAGYTYSANNGGRPAAPYGGAGAGAGGMFRGALPPPAPSVSPAHPTSHDYTRSSNDRHPVDPSRVRARAHHTHELITS